MGYQNTITNRQSNLLKEITEETRKRAKGYKNYITHKLLMSCFDNFITEKKCEKITPKTFGTDDRVTNELIAFRSFFSQVRRLEIFKSINVSDEQATEIYFTDDFRDYLETRFRRIYTQIDEQVSLPSQPSDDIKHESSNIVEFSEWLEQHPECMDEETKKNSEDGNNYIFRDTIGTMNDLFLLNNLNENFQMVFNPKIPMEKNFLSNSRDKIRSYEIIVFRKLDVVEQIDFVSKYVVVCSLCGGETFYTPKGIYQTFKCPCPLDSNSKAKPHVTSSGAENPISVRPFHLYEFELQNNPNHKLYAHCFDDSIIPGRYYVNILVSNEKINNKAKNGLVNIFLGVKKKRVEIDKNMFAEESEKKAREFCKKIGAPFTRGLIGIFEIRRLMEKHAHFNYTDKAFLMQIFCFLSGSAKVLFQWEKLGISCIGESSIGKTFVGCTFGMMFDEKYTHVSGYSDITAAGFRGGINQISVGGKAIRVFDEGIMSQGITVLDEASYFYEMDKPFNGYLKDFLSVLLDIKKIGGAKVSIRYTPWIFSNFYKNDMDYEEEVFNAYNHYIRQDPDAQLPHTRSRMDMKLYFSKLNLYYPLAKILREYDNKFLAKAIAFVRIKKERGEIDWKTGGSIPSCNRVMFDIVVKSKVVAKETYEFRDIILPSQNDMPHQEFREAMRKFYLGGKEFNLKEGLKSLPDGQMKSLQESIKKYLQTPEGRDIMIHLRSQDKQKVDDKLLSLVYGVFCIWILEENINAMELTKSSIWWARQTLLKTKRGVSDEEYDFIDHSYSKDLTTFDPTLFDFAKLDAEMSDITAAEAMEEKKMNIQQLVAEGLDKQKQEDFIKKIEENPNQTLITNAIEKLEKEEDKKDEK